ncbi:MAG: integrase core domain-containing protein [Steroidobacteraceae bacterium]
MRARPCGPVYLHCERCFVHSVSRAFRDEWLNAHRLGSIDDAQANREACCVHDNENRPHQAPHELTSNACAARGRPLATPESRYPPESTPQHGPRNRSGSARRNYESLACQCSAARPRGPRYSCRG